MFATTQWALFSSNLNDETSAKQLYLFSEIHFCSSVNYPMNYMIVYIGMPMEAYTDAGMWTGSLDPTKTITTQKTNISGQLNEKLGYNSCYYSYKGDNTHLCFVYWKR